ncbi:protein pelota [Pancytospora philotis]|nr:protein pelota [Pancytospora philotis]
MKIVSNQIDSKSRSGTVVLVPTCADDIYALSSVVFPEDVVEAHTTRKLSMDGGRSQQKISLRLAIKVETADFDLEDGVMSVKGRICKENEHVQQGTYHSIHVALNDKFELTKQRWTRTEQKILADSTKEVLGICFVVLYDKDCVVSAVGSNNIKNAYKAEIKNKNYKPAIAAVLALRAQARIVIIAGFSSANDVFYKALLKEDKTLEKSTTVVKLTPEYKNIPNAKVINKMLLDKQLSKAFSEVQYVGDLRMVEDFFVMIAVGKADVCVGFAEIEEALEYGALKTLFITDALYRPRTVEARKHIEKYIGQALELRAKICVIPEIHESGAKLKEMGGIAGVLQFSYK